MQHKTGAVGGNCGAGAAAGAHAATTPPRVWPSQTTYPNGVNVFAVL